MSTAKVFTVSCKAKHLPTEVRFAIAARRRAALSWLRAIARDKHGTRADVATASELIMCIQLDKPPSKGAISWLDLQSTRGDASHRGWARQLLADLGEE